mmetsp:Transcript_1771/g.4707  ORF Transcript_1771/g.4707 Transcript_1771/m.4707 type:complete len:117 (-) Transcript_1771:2169-2519(-)
MGLTAMVERMTANWSLRKKVFLGTTSMLAAAYGMMLLGQAGRRELIEQEAFELYKKYRKEQARGVTSAVSFEEYKEELRAERRKMLELEAEMKAKDLITLSKQSAQLEPEQNMDGN